jgi:para-nitrobenzyl esterase
VGCGDIRTAGECLRAIPVAKLDEPPWYYRIGSDSLTGPVTGTEELPIDPMTAFAQGRAARVPMLIGTNHDEFTLFVGIQYLRQGRAPLYPQVLTDTFGAPAGQIAERYPLDRYGGSAALAYSAAVTDGVFACPADQMAGALTRGAAAVYGYEFNDRGAPAPEPLRTLPFPVGASHSLELRYLFDIGAPALDPAQRRLSDQMIDYWARFVATGAPQVNGAPAWPALGRDVANGPRMSLQTGDLRTATTFHEEHQCPFWATIPARPH